MFEAARDGVWVEKGAGNRRGVPSYLGLEMRLDNALPKHQSSQQQTQ